MKIKNLFSRRKPSSPIKSMATDMSQVPHISSLDVLLEANASYIKAIFGALFDTKGVYDFLARGL